MTDLKHTPGPWDYFVGNSNGRGLIRVEVAGTAASNCGQHVASLHRGVESEANARLIAAAPELLAACKDMMENRGDWAARMSAAIDNAEGN